MVVLVIFVRVLSVVRVQLASVVFAAKSIWLLQTHVTPIHVKTVVHAKLPVSISSDAFAQLVSMEFVVNNVFATRIHAYTEVFV